MKKIIPLVIIFFLIVSNLSAQARDELNYFPLQVGNVWQYKITNQPGDYQVTTFYLVKKALADTLLTNGKRYFLVEQPPFTWEKFNTTERVLIRIDSTNGLIYKFISEDKPEERIDSLFAKVGDRISGKYICYNVSNKLVFSESRKSVTIGSPTSTNGNDFLWAKAMYIGIYYQSNYFCPVGCLGNSYELVYAKIDGKEYGAFVGVNEHEIIPSKHLLSQNYPNPFNPTTKIKFSIPAVKTLHATSLQYVTLKVFDILGNEIVTLVNEEKLPGNYEVTFNGNNLASGVYFYRLTTKDFSLNKKMILMK